MIELSIIIVNYNTRDLLKQCINSIMDNVKDISYEIIVTDNASSDDSIEMLNEEFPTVKLIKSKINGGFAYANNLAIKESKGKYLFLLNSDTIILKDVLSKMVRYMDENKEVGMLGPKLLNADFSHQTSISAFPTFKREVFHIYKIKNILKIPIVKNFFVKYGGKLGIKDVEQYMKNFQGINTPQEVQVLVGAALMFRREIIKDIGYLDERYFMYYEEIDYCYQAFKTGWSRVYYPYGEIIHLIGQSSKKISDVTFYERYKSMMKYFRKNYGVGKEIAVRINLIIGLFLRSIGLSLKQMFKPSKFYLNNLKIYFNTIKIALGINVKVKK